MNTNKMRSMVLVLLLMISAFPLTLVIGDEPVDRGDGVLENTGDWIIEDGEDFDYTDKTIIINGNLIINGSLSLTGCQLIMNSSYSSIVVNGEMYLENTNVSGNDTYYWFKVYGTFTSLNSNYADTASMTSEPYEGGLQIYSEDVMIDGGEIRDSEFVGMYLYKSITLWNLTVQNNVFNIVINGSVVDFFDCTIQFPGGDNIYLYNSSAAQNIDSNIGSGIRFDDDGSSYMISHLLSVHVMFENGTSIEDVMISARSSDNRIYREELTDEFGWVRNMILPEYTRWGNGTEPVHEPYLVVAEKFDLKVMKSIPFTSSTSFDMILTGDYFGEAIARGDFNGDGLSDVAVGVPRNTTGIQMPGAVFIFLNDGFLEFSDLTEENADIYIMGLDGSSFGEVLAAGDINGDGFDDLLVGSPEMSENGEGSGRVSFFMGSADPQWDSYDDADFAFDGSAGDHLGMHILVADLDNDPYLDFVTGDAMRTHVFYGVADPVAQFTSVAEYDSYPTAAGAADDTSQSISKVQTDNNERYDVDPQEVMHLVNFTRGNLHGEVSEMTLEVQWVTDRYFGYYQEERGYVYYSIDGDNWHETVLPIAPNNNWDRETTQTFDLYADGVRTLDQLENLQIWYRNEEGQRGQDHYIHFDYVVVKLVASPVGENHTLEKGNLSAGDVNGDGFLDLIISDIGKQEVYFSSEHGLSAPEVLEIEDHTGDFNLTYNMNGNLTLEKTGRFENGNFDDGWDHWTLVENSAGQLNTELRLVDEQTGDWDVSPYSGGPTGGFGDDSDELNGRNGNSPGMLRSDDFFISNEVKTIQLWYHWDIRSFESGEGVNIKLYRASDNTPLQTLAEWMSGSDNENHDESELINVDITNLSGETVYLGMEALGGDGGYDDALFQIDDVDLIPSFYYENGTFESDWIIFERNLSAITPGWYQELNNGTLSVKFRSDDSVNWTDVPEAVNGDKIDITGTSNRTQYRIEMTNNGSNTPLVADLSIGYLLEGQILPVYATTSYGRIVSGDVNGDGPDDLLFLDGESRGGIEIYYGADDIQETFNEGDITGFYSGSFFDVTFLDLELDGQDEVVIGGTTTKIVDDTASTVWELDAKSVSVTGDIGSDPGHHLNTGIIHFLPAFDRELRILDIVIPDLVPPDENQEIDVIVGNLGIADATGLTLYLNITADSYTHEDSMPLDLDSMTMDTFSFSWDVPAEEGVDYEVQAEVHLKDDRVPENDDLIVNIKSMQHGIRMTSSDLTDSAHGGDELSFPIRVENIGTFDSEDTDLDYNLPPGWTGEYRYEDTPVTSIDVFDFIDLVFVAVSPLDEENDDFILNLTGEAASATAGIDLTATILRPDLIVEEIALFREDGVRTNDTIHGVEGDLEKIMVKVTNTGPTYATTFNVTLELNDNPVRGYTHPGLASGESVWFSYQFRPDTGILNVTVMADALLEVPEMDEDNNELSWEFDIKTTAPVGDYNITGIIRDIFGEGVELAEVNLEWDGNDETLHTDENGSFSYHLWSWDYADTMVLYVNGTDGKNITSARIILYSEDGGVFLDLTLNQYIVEITGPDSVSNIVIGGQTTITVEVTNKGNTNASFIMEIPEMPDDWTVELVDVPEGKLYLSMDEAMGVDILITGSADPAFSQGYQRYFLEVLVYAEIYAEANDIYSHAVEVLPDRMLMVEALSDNTTSAQPYDELSFDCRVSNSGNIKDTLIPEIYGDMPDDYWFNISYAVLEIDEFADFTFTLIMPYVTTGTLITIYVGSPEGYVKDTMLEITTLDYYSIDVEYPDEITGEPLEELDIPLTVENTGNLPENIAMDPWSPREGVTTVENSVYLEMMAKSVETIGVTLPADALMGDVIMVYVNLSVDQFWINITLEILITEIRGISLVELQKTVHSGMDFTTYRTQIEAENLGNSENTFFFDVEGGYPELVSLPAPITLLAHEKTTFHVDTVTPLNYTQHIENYLIPMDDTKSYTSSDLTLSIPKYEMNLITSYDILQEEDVFIFTIFVKNNGTRFERLNVVGNYPKEDWDLQSNKEVLELMPGESDTFEFRVETPPYIDSWGDELAVTLESDSGHSERIKSHKPPIPYLGFAHSGIITIETELSFYGGASLNRIEEFFWDFGDGTNYSGPTAHHTYNKAGEFTVTFTIVDNMSLTATKTVDLEIENRPPEPTIITSPLNKTVFERQPIKFDGSKSTDRDGEIVSYKWDFGDFSDGNWPVEEHSYETAGVYQVMLKVTDNFGLQNYINITVYVMEKTVKPDDTTEQIKETKTTDPLSYVPMLLAVIVLVAGAVFIIHKRNFIEAMKEKIAEEQKKLLKKRL